MEFNIEIRRKQLENLDQFISSSKDRVDSILDYLGWNAQKIAENQKEMVKCMINPSHRIPASSAASHMQSCAWRKEMYDDDDIPLSEPNPIPGSTIIIDDMTKVNVLNNALTVNPHMKTGWRSTEPVPKTSNRLISTFTPDERLALYDYTITSTKAPPSVPEFNIEPKIEEKHNLTPREIEALERDAKRRRIKYKSKSVHTKNKSATEVIREVIDNQMEQYEEWLKEKNDTTDTVKQEKSDRVDSSNEIASPASPRSSRSQYSYKSEESRHKNNRTLSREVSRDRSRSSSRKRDRYSRHDKYDHKNDYSSRRKYEDRDYEKRNFEKKKYEEREYEKKKYEEREFEKKKYEEREFEKKKYEEREFEKKKYEDKNYETRKYESRDPRKNRSRRSPSRTKSEH